MDERWLLNPIDPPPTADDVLSFGASVVRDGECLVWAGHVDEAGAPVVCLSGGGDGLHPAEFAFAAAYGGVPRAGYDVAQSCGRDRCVTPGHLGVVRAGGEEGPPARALR